MSIVEKSIRRAKDRNGGSAPSLAKATAAQNLPPAVPARVRIDLPPATFDGTIGPQSGYDPAAGKSGLMHSQLRAIKRKVLDAVAERRAGGEGATVLVTSAVPGDGKSFMAFHLALAFTAEHDIETALVDADVARHRVSSLFKASDGQGLGNCLMDREPIANVLRDTDIPNLAIAPAGNAGAAVSEALASERWDRIAAEMRAAGSESVFIIDSAPVLATPEAQYLARTVDLVLFVVRSEITPQHAVREALQRLGNLKRVAFVFNDYVTVGTDYRYDYSSYAPAAGGDSGADRS
jgi:Mrp family chromosome partitioning ATPase